MVIETSRPWTRGKSSVINRLNDIFRATVQPLVITGGLAPDSDADGNGVVLQSQVKIAGMTVSRRS